MTTEFNVVGPEYLSPILHLPVATIKTYSRQYPERLPPRFRPPGIKKLLWIESDVITWMNSFRPKVEAPRGRRFL